MPAFKYGAKSQKRLTVACDLVRSYQTLGKDLSAANIQWNQVEQFRNSVESTQGQEG